MSAAVSHETHFIENFDTDGRRDPRGTVRAELRSNVSAEDCVYRAVVSALIREINVQFTDLPPGSYFCSLRGQANSCDVTSVRFGSEISVSKDSEFCPIASTNSSESGLAHLSSVARSSLIRFLGSTSEQPICCTIRFGFDVKEKPQNDLFPLIGDMRALKRTVQCLLDEKKAAFSAEILAATVARLSPVEPQALKELVEVLGKGDRYDTEVRDRLGWVYKVALLPVIIDSGLLSPALPWVERDKFLDEYLPILELDELLRNRIEARKTTRGEGADFLLSALISNEIDEAQRPCAIHSEDGLSAEKHFSRAEMWKSLAAKYDLTTLGSFFDAINEGRIPKQVIEVLIESDLLDFALREDTEAACPGLAELWNAAGLRMSARVDETLEAVQAHIVAM